MAKITKSGIRFNVGNEINETWCEYDKAVAKMHLANYGVIFLDEYDCPIDNEYDLEEIATCLA